VQQWQAHQLVENFRRKCRRVSVGDTVADLSVWLWETLSWKDRVDPVVIHRLWAMLPGQVRGEFAVAVCRAAAPEYRYPLWIREGAPMTLEELEKDAALRTERVRAWATEFCRFLAESEPEHAQQGVAADTGRHPGSARAEGPAGGLCG
jgi:hypothetical protein